MKILCSGKIISDFEGFAENAVFKMDNGTYWIQSECKRWNCSAYMPDAVIYEDNSRTILSVANQPVLVHRIYNVIESQIDGDFEGCNGDSRYKLMNGQVWEQTNSMYKYKYAYCPKVTIIQYNSKHIMYVKGMQIPVRRV